MDHVRDFTTIISFQCRRFTHKQRYHYSFTRWVTHFCAPVFMFVAGVGSGLGEINGKSKKELSHFLWTRGLWLVLLELTVVKLAWTFNFTDKTIYFLVIWALGMSMITLAVLIYVPKKVAF
ncbi:MAG: heparan-alpha-glucosaminide N-acetyltransferase domain-containing protein [Cyclobacteriaceae bacterium]|nr:heparan-alpha-glucosaminide N-acetyltransferase domain-containing protein [Cyclobacteriaceae bacterium]